MVTVLDSLALEPILEQVDGPPIYQYEGKEATYTGRSCKVYGQSSLDVPIRISAPGSIVEYTIEQKSYDFGLGITAKLDQGGVTTVKEMGPFDGKGSSMSVQQRPKTNSDQMLVGAGSVPCTLNFKFENNMSWIVELSYKIRVIPPNRNVLLEGRRRRANACLKALDYDVGRTNQRLNDLYSEKRSLEQEVQALSERFQSIEGNMRSINDVDNTFQSTSDLNANVRNIAGRPGNDQQQQQQQQQQMTSQGNFVTSTAAASPSRSSSFPSGGNMSDGGNLPFLRSGGSGQSFPPQR
jgi:uncharacterized protein YoxC